MLIVPDPIILVTISIQIYSNDLTIIVRVFSIACKCDVCIDCYVTLVIAIWIYKKIVCITISIIVNCNT